MDPPFLLSSLLPFPGSGRGKKPRTEQGVGERGRGM